MLIDHGKICTKKGQQRMKKQYFQWNSFVNEHESFHFSVDAIGEIYLLDLKENSIWLSKKLADLLYYKNPEKPDRISIQEFEAFFPERSRIVFRQEIQRLRAGRTSRENCHVALEVAQGCLSAFSYMYHVGEPDYLLGFLSVDYEPTREYEHHLEQVISELKNAQSVNQLILEGAVDYIFQLNFADNTCTLSPKALEILSLDSPAFSDALDRLLSFVVVEDRQIFLDSLTPFLSGNSLDQYAEFRLQTKSGKVIWVRCQSRGLHDAQGNPLLLAGSLLDITEQKEKEQKIRQMLYYDILTGLKNRRSFLIEMDAVLQDPDEKGCILYMDIRKFKSYNEMFGHKFGDQVLKEFAKMLKLYFPQALGIYRFGGDEFLIHLKDHKKEKVLERLTPFQHIVSKPRELDGHIIYVDTFTAALLYPEHGHTAEELLGNANLCLYHITREDNRNVSFFAKQNSIDFSRQYQLENEMRLDIEHDFRHFRVVYQPIVKHENGSSRWIGAEALLRYSNPHFPNLGQMEMIQTLEYSGLILPIGRWVLKKAIRECSKWNSGGNHVVVHVNIAAQQVSDASLVQYVKEQCESSGLIPSNLTLELTETSILNNLETAIQFCQKLRDLGIGVALDDFGTGYSGFRYLRGLPISQIKVDREYTSRLPVNQYNQVVVSFLHDLSQNMDLELCAEGVEKQDELDFLNHMGISMIQGFYFERPMEAEIISKEFPQRSVCC